MSEKEKIKEEMKKTSKEKKLKFQEDIKEFQNKYLRTLAELENTRHRMQKEKSEAIIFAIENTIAEFLPVIDNFENALNFANKSSDEVKNWAQGFQMILSQIKDVFHNHGIIAFHSIGNIFDPHLHEAMEILKTNDHPDGSIIEEFAKGYKTTRRIIRPAKVKIAQKIPVPSQEDPQKINDEKKDDEKNIFEPINASDEKI